MKVHNLISEVEYKVQTNDIDGDDDKSIKESMNEYNPKANKVPSDDTFKA